MRGTPQVWNPYHGYQDLRCETEETARILSTIPLGMSVDAMEDRTSTGPLVFPYPTKIENQIMQGMERPAMKPSLHVTESTIRGVLGRIRTIVLQWSLDLEKRGVIGEGATFSDKERSQASAITIGTFIQGVTGSQLQVNSPGANQQHGLSADQLTDLTKLVQLVTSVLDGNTAQTDELNELRAEIATIRAQVSSPKPKRSVLKESLSSVRAILEGTASEVLAGSLPALMPMLAHLTSSL